MAYSGSINSPFLLDDYVHLDLAGKEDAGALLSRVLWTHPTGGDLFFRPAGSIYLWLVFQAAGLGPLGWHLFSMAIHASNSVLLFILARRLSSAVVPAFAGALLFAWQGAHVEDVCWLAASFDLLATFFSLAVLALVLRSRSSYNTEAAVVLLSILACLSKESAYCLPLLAACLALFFDEPHRRTILIRSIKVAAGCSCAFIYRLWFLQGFGGYRTAAGRSIETSIHVLSTAQALGLRIWGLLFLPINWSVPPQAWLAIAALLMLIVLATVATRQQGLNRLNLLPAILFVLAAALPVIPLLLIGSDLAGARVLYLPSVGYALTWTVILQAVRWKPMMFALAGAVCLFQLAALLHNQLIWVQVAAIGRQACVDAADIQKKHPNAPIAVYGLPKVLNGVYFLQNGFPECVSINGGVSADNVLVPQSPPQASHLNAHSVFWNSLKNRMEAR